MLKRWNSNMLILVYTYYHKGSGIKLVYSPFQWPVMKY